MQAEAALLDGRDNPGNLPRGFLSKLYKREQ
jgi:hypothetical protein